MIVAHSVEELASRLPDAPVHWALGFFDGVHRGHRRVVFSAATTGALCGVLTFAEHPLSLLAPERQPFLLTPQAGYKAALLEQLGVDVLLQLPFMAELAAMEPQEFLDWLEAACPRGIAGLSVGENWRFGHGGRGDAAFLRRWGEARGCRICIQPMLREGGEPVCSSRIRRCLAEGALTEVESLLGHPFCICGVVEQGQQLARTFGFPTANITLPARAALPPMGVYEVALEIDGQRRCGVANLGLRPTIDEVHKPVRLEVHVIGGWQGNMYGKELRVELCRFIRPERRFESLDALRSQMAADVASVGR